MAEGRTRRFLITGLAALLPTLLTIYLFYALLVWIHTNVGSKFNDVLRFFNVEITPWAIFVGDAIAFLLFMGLVWLAGFLLATYLGKLFFRRLDKAFRRIPLLRIVYPALKQVSDFFLERKEIPFNRVVAVEYPRRGIFSVGFHTGDGLRELTDENGERLIGIFIPNTPAPLTGFTIFVPRAEVIPLDLTVDEAIKLIVSGGVVVPQRERIGAPPAPKAGAEDRSAEDDAPGDSTMEG